MAETDQISIGSLHQAVLRETEGESVLELDPDFYRSLAGRIGDIRRQEFDGVEGKIKDAMVGMFAELTSLLIEIRLEKVSKFGNLEPGRLLDEEKFILDSEEDRQERTQMILSATLDGRSQFLESLAQRHRARAGVVRFLKPADEMMGADLKKYGPFEPEDIATLPYDNAQSLIAGGVAARVRADA